MKRVRRDHARFGRGPQGLARKARVKASKILVDIHYRLRVSPVYRAFRSQHSSTRQLSPGPSVPVGSFKFGFLVLTLALTSCNSAKNLAANFIPTGKQDVELQDIKSGTYQLDPEHANLTFSFVHMGFSNTRVRFDAFDATLKFDHQTPGQTSLVVNLDPASLNTNITAFDELLISKDFFDVENFPEANFKSTEVYFTSSTSAEIPGTLTLHGVSAPAVFYVTLGGAGKNWISGKYTLGFSGKAEVNRSAFGLKNMLALTGDTVTIEFDAEFNLEK